MTITSIYAHEILKSFSNAEFFFEIKWNMQFGKLFNHNSSGKYFLQNVTVRMSFLQNVTVRMLFFKKSVLTGY